MGQRQIRAAVNLLSPKTSPAGYGCTPVPSSSYQLTNSPFGRQFLLKHTMPSKELAPASLLISSLRSLGPQFPEGGLSPLKTVLPPSPTSQLVIIFLVSWKGPRQGAKQSSSPWCHNPQWPGASLDNTSHHPHAPSLPLRWICEASGKSTAAAFHPKEGGEVIPIHSLTSALG